MLWTNCTHFWRKKGCWALTALLFIAALSFFSRHIKGVCLHSTICLPSSSSSKKKKKFQKNRDVFVTLWAVHVQLPESHPTLQRENPGKIVVGELVSAPRQCACLLLTVTDTNICMLTPLNDSCYLQLPQYAQYKSIRPERLLAGGLSCLGGVQQLDTARHQQMGANEIRACTISTLRPPFPASYLSCVENLGTCYSWVNTEGPEVLGALPWNISKRANPLIYCLRGGTKEDCA